MNSRFLDILGVEAGLEQQEDGLEEHERAQSEAVAATIFQFCRKFSPEVDEEGGGREMKDEAA